MKKSEAVQIQKAEKAVQVGMRDYAARALSCVYRSAMTKKTQAEVIAKAIELGVADHEEFII